MMWPPTGKLVSGSWLRLQPVRILYEMDGPRIFVCADSEGHPFLAYQCGESDRLMRFLIVPLPQQVENKLTAGELDLQEVLHSPQAWLFDVDFDWTVVQTWEVNPFDLPENALPRAGIMLWPHLMRQPIIDVGSNGHVQASAPPVLDH